MNKQLRTFTKDCISHYAVYDKLDKFYHLNIQDLPDFVQHEFAAMIISDDVTWGTEAASPENPHWETKMLPALIRYLKNSSDKDESIEFNNVWRDCVTDYMIYKMQQFIDEVLYDFNDDHGLIRKPSYYYGIPAHGQI